MEENASVKPLSGKTILITGAARRIGRHLALYVAEAGARVIVHHAHSPVEAEEVCTIIRQTGGEAYSIAADLNDLAQAAGLIPNALRLGGLDMIIHNAAIFEPLSFYETSVPQWQEHMNINLTAPFLISQAFATNLPEEKEGRILNILDWRALRPGADHFPYTISKAGLAALTQSMAVALAPRITVNGLAFGAILPPSDGAMVDRIIQRAPIKRWASLDEVCQSVLFLLSGPTFITGEILHLDGGRHLV